MKLLNITTRYFLLLLLGLLIPWTAIFYFSVRHSIYHHVDEFLANRKFEIMQETNQNPALLHDSSRRKTDFILQPIRADQFKTLNETYKDTQVFEPLEKEMEPYRQLETAFQCHQGYYKLTILASLTDNRVLLSKILFNVVLLFIALIILMVVLNWLLLGRLWQPFRASLQQIRQYRLDHDAPIQFEATSISEFTELNKALMALIDNHRQVYQHQKQFTENASHEIQTPLAIARNKVELLMQDASLLVEQAELVGAVNDHLSRLARLNKSLLLLAKIENHQFPEVQEVEVVQLVRRISDDLGEMINFKGLNLTIEAIESVWLRMNPDLADIFFGNLIRNAIFHNVPGGYIRICIGKGRLLFENSGTELQEDPARFFERFAKNSAASPTQGLGLSLVQSIGNLYQLKVKYTASQAIHQLTVTC
ncbi:MAG: HAMP domain-containing sensor histidine kinase [Bacteroidota bacterium]